MQTVSKTDKKKAATIAKTHTTVHFVQEPRSAEHTQTYERTNNTHFLTGTPILVQQTALTPFPPHTEYP